MSHPVISPLEAALYEDRFCAKLHDPSFVARWVQRDPVGSFVPVSSRVNCCTAIEAAAAAFPEIHAPTKGWCGYVLQYATAQLYPRHRCDALPEQEDFALCALRSLQWLLDEERQALPFDASLDFAFCSEAESADSPYYRVFADAWREGFLYELLRLSDELTPWCTLAHIAMVHHVAMTVARALKDSGEAVDLAMVSAAAAGHDVGKFGCMAGERVPYLHYYYTDNWFTDIGLPQVGHLSANHSTWDLELANLSVESMLLIYADFRSKQQRRTDGREEAALYTLRDAFDVILHKLDQVDAAKQRRYEYVYRKLHDFEEYLISRGVDVTLQGQNTAPEPPQDIALMSPAAYARAFRLTAVEHNLRMMRLFSRDALFSGLLEQARSEKRWARLRAYLCIFEEYFTYLSSQQKIQTVYFLYELLMHPEGDIRRQAATLMGSVIAKFSLRYKKELPDKLAQEAVEQTQFALWAQYLNLLFYPDRKLAEQQIRHIRYTAKLVISATLEQCAPQETRLFLAVLLAHYPSADLTDEGAALALADTLCYLPLSLLTAEELEHIVAFALSLCRHDSSALRCAALQFFCYAAKTLSPERLPHSAVAEISGMGEQFTTLGLRYLYALLCTPQRDPLASVTETDVSDILLDNLKTATPWITKVVNVELLSALVQRREAYAMQVSTHFANLLRVSEAVVVRRRAGRALLAAAPLLTCDQRNEVAVELAKGLEAGHYEFSKYIPQFLGEFMLYLRPAELDEVIDYLVQLLSHADEAVAAESLDTVGCVLEHYHLYALRFPEDESVWDTRRRRLAGILLKGIASYREGVQREAMFVIGDTLFSSAAFPDADKAWFFTLCLHKLLFLIGEERGEGLNYLYCSAALYRIYQFVVHYETDHGAFAFRRRTKVAFFPGTFDPFTLSHKGVVTTIRDMGFEVFLAVDEFSWSKKTQPSLIRRKIVSMSVADEFHVHLFPYDVPVNLASPDDLLRLRSLFADCELYLIVGSDVVQGASSYRAPPCEGSVHSMNHVVFRRVSALHGVADEHEPDVSMISGKVVQLQLPSQLEDISSTRIRENIDLNRDISHLIDPVVQEYILQRGLYLREPQYKPLLAPGTLAFSTAEGDALPALLVSAQQTLGLPQKAADGICCRGERVMSLTGAGELLAVVSFTQLRVTELFSLLHSASDVNAVRDAASGKLLCLTGLYAQSEEAAQHLLTELFAAAINEDCLWALYVEKDVPAAAAMQELLLCQGLQPVVQENPALLLADMSAPVVLLQNVETAIKAPFNTDSAVLETICATRRNLKRSLLSMYPGKLLLTISSQLLIHRLVEKITALNGVPLMPTAPRTLGPYMCVPFGKLLRGQAVPNTVTKTIHTDKVFAADLQSQWIEAFPGYAPLRQQMRTVHSFRRPVILVDDQLHTGRRISVLDPLARSEQVEVRELLVGILSGRGRDLMEQLGHAVDYVYFVPNIRAWYVESTLYPFIGGDTVARPDVESSGLQPSVNLILPYAYPEHLHACGAAAVYGFSKTCLANTLAIIESLERAYRGIYARSLTLRRLGSVVILPLCPEKGCMRYEPDRAVSDYLKGDLSALERLNLLFM